MSPKPKRSIEEELSNLQDALDAAAQRKKALEIEDERKAKAERERQEIISRNQPSAHWSYTPPDLRSVTPPPMMVGTKLKNAAVIGLVTLIGLGVYAVLPSGRPTALDKKPGIVQEAPTTRKDYPPTITPPGSGRTQSDADKDLAQRTREHTPRKALEMTYDAIVDFFKSDPKKPETPPERTTTKRKTETPKRYDSPKQKRVEQVASSEPVTRVPVTLPESSPSIETRIVPPSPPAPSYAEIKSRFDSDISSRYGFVPNGRVNGMPFQHQERNQSRDQVFGHYAATVAMLDDTVFAVAEQTDRVSPLVSQSMSPLGSRRGLFYNAPHRIRIVTPSREYDAARGSAEWAKYSSGFSQVREELWRQVTNNGTYDPRERFLNNGRGRLR